MREIKFRVWDQENNKFFEPTYEAYQGKLEDLSIDLSGELMMRTIENPAIHESLFPNRFIINQYTGLKDKKEVEIYEGDIIKNHWFNVYKKFIGDIWIVKFGEHDTSEDYYASSAYGWYGENRSGRVCSLVQLPGEIEVIGNIYKNSELISMQ